MTIRQFSSLQCPFLLRHVQSHFYFDNLNSNKTDLQSYKISEMMDNLNRNPAYFYFNEFSTNYGELTSDKTIINLHVKVHELKIRYRKTFWRHLSEKWIVYLSLFLITLTLANFTLGFLFEKRFLWARRISNFKNKDI